jgi:HAE1 family hydrophobic/amphiphilic exporter-1
MARHHRMVADKVRAHPAVERTVAFLIGTNTGFVFANLKPREDRERSADEVIEDLRPAVMEVPGMLTFLQNPPPITVGSDFTSAYQLTLQSTNPDELYQWAPKLLERMRTLPGFVDLNTSMRISSPELQLDIDRDRAQSLGVSPEAIHNALFSAYSGRQVSVIYTPSNQYPVLLEVLPEQQRSPAALSKLRVRSASGALVPIETLVRTKRQVGPLSIDHYGQLPSVSITFNLAQGHSLGGATEAVDNLILELRMPATISTNFQGTVREFQRSFEGMSILLVVAILVIYIVLGVLYESFIHPLTILSGLPAAVFGALVTLSLFGKQIDLYAFVGLIMLFGVVKKNAIMMVDFAIAARQEGLDAREAIWRGCLLRFRPIMMTTVAALFGTLPIALGYGQGGDARQPLGLAVVGGLVVSQFLTLYITPVIYLYLDRLQAKLRRQRVPVLAPEEARV